MNAAVILAVAGPAEDAGWRDNVIWFRRLVFTHMAARSFLTFSWGAGAELGEQLLRGSIILVALVGCAPRASVWAARIATMLLLAEVCFTLPFTANHVFLELILLMFLSFLKERDEKEEAVLLQAMRWLGGVMFFYTGLQKLLYGYYFDGQFLAYVTGTEDRFAAFFKMFVPAEELERLRSYNESLDAPGVHRPAIGSGPYRVDSPVFFILSNGVYLFEMVAGVALLLPRTRVLAALASIFFVIMIEAGARELTFGVLMINMLLLYVPGAWVKICYPGFAAFYVYLAAAKFGWVPMFDYSPA